MNGLTAVAGDTGWAWEFPETPEVVLSEAIDARMEQHRIRLLVMLYFLGLAACRTGPSVEEYVEFVRSRAGEGATACGIVRLGQDRTAAVACATAALEQGHPIFVIFQVQGIDSDIYYGLSLDNKGAAMRAIWDSDIHGGGRLTARARTRSAICKNPQVVAEGQPIQCGD